MSRQARCRLVAHSCMPRFAVSSIAAAGKGGQAGRQPGYLFQRLLQARSPLARSIPARSHMGESTRAEQEPRRAAEDLRRGFITFKLYKFGEWIQARRGQSCAPRPAA